MILTRFTDWLNFNLRGVCMPFKKVNVEEELQKRFKDNQGFKKIYKEVYKELRLKVDLNRSQENKV